MGNIDEVEQSLLTTCTKKLHNGYPRLFGFSPKTILKFPLHIPFIKAIGGVQGQKNHVKLI